jgi:hypothetical protein
VVLPWSTWAMMAILRRSLRDVTSRTLRDHAEFPAPTASPSRTRTQSLRPESRARRFFTDVALTQCVWPAGQQTGGPHALMGLLAAVSDAHLNPAGDRARLLGNTTTAHGVRALDPEGLQVRGNRTGPLLRQRLVVGRRARLLHEPDRPHRHHVLAGLLHQRLEFRLPLRSQDRAERVEIDDITSRADRNRGLRPGGRQHQSTTTAHCHLEQIH